MPVGAGPTSLARGVTVAIPMAPLPWLAARGGLGAPGSPSPRLAA